MRILTPPARVLPSSPIPPREGISPVRVVLRGSVPAGPVFYAGAAGDSDFDFGEILPPGHALRRPTPAWHYPELPEETPIPFDFTTVDERAGLIVVDKPPFLPTTPNGRLVRETLQTRARLRYGNDDIVALHRLDRLTCGLVALSSAPENRGFYQQQFAQRTARKRYRALLSAELPVGERWETITLPMRKIKGQRQVQVDARGKATVTRVRSVKGPLIELEPLTGHTHQLRVLCAYLGAPIVGDDTYPIDKGLQIDNYSEELRLCATHLELALWAAGERWMWVSPRLADKGFWGCTD